VGARAEAGIVDVFPGLRASAMPMQNALRFFGCLPVSSLLINLCPCIWSLGARLHKVAGDEDKAVKPSVALALLLVILACKAVQRVRKMPGGVFQSTGSLARWLGGY